MAKKPTRKRVTMLVTVSIPAEYSATDARREVKANIQHQSMHSMEYGDVKLIGCRPAPKPGGWWR